MEKTLVVLKPDAVKRAMIGEIIKRFENVGLKIVASKMLVVKDDLATKHYPAGREEFITGMGKKTLENYEQMGVNPKEELGTKDPHKIGLTIRGWLVKYITSGPVLALVFEGPHAVELVRKIVGHTLPLKSAPGTIRGDLAFDSSYLANSGKRAIKNLVHASGSVEEAKFEISLWFKDEEICSYKRVDEDVMIK